MPAGCSLETRTGRTCRSPSKRKAYSHGIAYDPTDDSLWLLQVYSNGIGDLLHYDTSGNQLGKFPINGPGAGSGIALDLADQTLWVYDTIYEDLWQYDKLGNALQGLYVPDLHGKLGGAEFGPPFDCVEYCWANPNSSGAKADLHAVGTASASAGNLFVSRAPCPTRTASSSTV
jgi:hypothetical protein